MDDEYVGQDGYSGDEGAPVSERVENGGPLGKIQNAIGMMCLGIICFPLSLGLLGYNEKNYVCENKAIIYVDDKTTEMMTCDSTGIDNEILFFSCPILNTSLKTYTPQTFNPRLSSTFGNALSFNSAAARQNIEYMVCEESCQKVNQGKVKTCTYLRVWSSFAPSTTTFLYQTQAQRSCPGYVNGNGNTGIIQTSGLADFGVTEDHVSSLLLGSAKAPFEMNEILVKQALSPNTDVPLYQFANNFPGYAATTSSTLPTIIDTTTLAIQGNYLTTCPTSNPYLTNNGDAIVGCVRISYMYTAAQQASVLAQVTDGGRTGPIKIPASWMCDSKSDWQKAKAKETGGYTKREFMDSLRDANVKLAWILRIVGVCLAWLSVYCCFQPIAAAADILGDCMNFIPCVGGCLEDFIEGMVTSILCVLSCGIGCSCAFFVIAVCWVAMRPLIGGCLLAVACCCCGAAIGVGYYFKSDKPKKGMQRSFDEDEGGEE